MRRLDLFCGAGGAAMGYSRAGFTEIVGVDNRPQPRYPFTFIQGDALEYVAAHVREFDAIHASPPCQGYSIMRNLPWLRHKEYPLLIQPTADALNESGRPWIIENVMGPKSASKEAALTPEERMALLGEGQLIAERDGLRPATLIALATIVRIGTGQ